MIAKLTVTLALLVLSGVYSTLYAQPLKVRNYSIGYRVFEVDPAGNNPRTIIPLLKNAKPYQDFLDTNEFNSLHGGLGIQVVQNFYATMEFHKQEAAGFWRRHTVQAGLLITRTLESGNMGLGNHHYDFTDTSYRSAQLNMIQHLQFAGALIGINRRMPFARRFTFATGLHLQGSMAIVHKFEQWWDSIAFHKSSGVAVKRTQLDDLKGRNFFQWQATLPLALEMDVYRKQCFMRLEFNLGIVGGRYRHPGLSGDEAHGAGLWFIYRPL